YIPAQDRSRVRVGNSVKVSVTGVNQTKYGMLQGKINEISAGTVFQNGSEENSQLLYQIIIELNNTNLKSNKDTIKVEASMPVVANIIYDKETYLEWILNELNLKK
ncbi:MAG: secretion protein HlyD, partial [Enterococcus aquimarinus]